MFREYGIGGSVACLLFRKVFKELVKLSRYSNLAPDKLGIVAFLGLLWDVKENSSTEKLHVSYLKK